MESINIEKKWLSIDNNSIKGYRYVRLDNECVPELNIGFNSDGLRIILLELPIGFTPEINQVKKKNLTIVYLSEVNSIAIELINVDYKDLFNDLLFSIYQKIKDIKHVEDYFNEFIITFSKWIEFFENSRDRKLSETQVQGLFGELFLLKDYIQRSEKMRINYTLRSWQGPYKANNDFEFFAKNVEVKTKNSSNSVVEISNEFQLEKQFNKTLELQIVSIKLDFIDGESLHDILLDIINQIRKNLGDLSILFDALLELNLTVENIKIYNNYRFSVSKVESFDAGDDDFPKLINSKLEDPIFDLKYKLNVNQLDRFLLESKTY